jgi:hypothetical protein
VPCVKQLLKHHRGQPEGVDIEQMAGTFRLLYATRNAAIMKPEIGCTCLQALAELFAAAQPQCRSWLPEQWHQRRMVRMPIWTIVLSRLLFLASLACVIPSLSVVANGARNRRSQHMRQHLQGC